MTKELSKQICEKCGIEPKRECKLTKCKDYNCINCDKNRKLYPDFGQSENFVKLLELDFINKNKLGWETEWTIIEYLIHCTEVLIKDREHFLEILLNELNCSYAKEDIKQSIREAEWKYE